MRFFDLIFLLPVIYMVDFRDNKLIFIGHLSDKIRHWIRYKLCLASIPPILI